jgi:hypothetical protein
MKLQTRRIISFLRCDIDHNLVWWCHSHGGVRLISESPVFVNELIDPTREDVKWNKNDVVWIFFFAAVAEVWQGRLIGQLKDGSLTPLTL